METRSASGSAAVSEVLNVDNYLVWSVQVKTYLMAQDLWDIVEGTDKRPEPKFVEATDEIPKPEIVEATDESPKPEIVEATDLEIVEATDESPKPEIVEATDLEIVEATDERLKPENDEAALKAWTRKNAMALHVIQISCEPRICFVISQITSAQIAWDTLAIICSKPKSSFTGISLSLSLSCTCSNIIYVKNFLRSGTGRYDKRTRNK